METIQTVLAPEQAAMMGIIVIRKAKKKLQRHDTGNLSWKAYSINLKYGRI
jgi:hypothetical protein